MSTVIIQRKQGAGCLVQGIWFLFIGWWAVAAWIVVAWFLCAIIIGLPIGIAMLNRVPQVLALRTPNADDMMIIQEGRVVQTKEQYNFIVRAIWFLLVGLWLSAIWMVLAYPICLTIIGLPLGFWMFDRVPLLVTLQR